MSTAPQIIWIVLTTIRLLNYAVQNGKEKPKDTYNFAFVFILSLISAGLLYWGGFFNPLMK